MITLGEYVDEILSTIIKSNESENMKILASRLRGDPEFQSDFLCLAAILISSQPLISSHVAVLVMKYQMMIEQMKNDY